ncbi:MAG: type 2 lanthipeptide synthetase LanM family protein [Thermoanaerobaculia bacterium]
MADRFTSASAEALLARWRDRAARNDPAAFDRRLAWDGWDLATARRRLVSGPLPSPAALPAWQETLRQIEEEADPEAKPLAASPPFGGAPIPFEDLFSTHLEHARRRVERDLTALGLGDAISAAARHDLDRGLAERLSSLAGEALMAAFDDYRGGPPSRLAVGLAEAGARRETRLYRAFVDAAAHRGALSRNWPVLARLTATVVDSWARNLIEMMRRLQEDSVLLTGEPLAPAGLLRATPGLSDPHCGGRTVHLLTLTGGGLVYKPRSLGPEEDFARLLDWCGERELSLDLRSPRTLDRGTHGWMELMSPADCPDEPAARRFHRRAGMLLGLLYAFGSRDCHFENLIACGEHPILVDLEAWLPVRLRRWPPGSSRGEAWDEAARRIERSVLSTGLLPQWQEGRRGELRSVGALGGGLPGRRLQTVWRAVNSDAMVRVWREVETEVQPNVPRLAGTPLEPSAFLTEVESGFTEMYTLLERHRGELLGPRGPLSRLAGRRTRLILRSTAAYRKLLARSLSPECCRDGAARSIELEFLARAYLEAESRPAVWPLLTAERQALEQADVPLFLVPVDGTRIELPDGGAVEGALATSSLAAVAESLGELGAEDLQLQTGFLRAALAPSTPVLPAMLADDVPPAAGRENGVFLVAARAIAERLNALAVLGADGSAAWIGPRYFPAGEIYEMAALGPDLYSGTAGIALFLAAFAHATGDAVARETALRATETLRRSVDGRNLPDLGIGGLTGISSILYAFVWMGELLGEERLIREASALSVHLDSERIAADRDLDVVFGSAGAILSLLALDRVFPQSNSAGRTPLDIASECADNLLARRLATDRRSPRGWPARGGTLLPGFSHGASGICHALLRLYERNGRRDLRDAACEGLDFERRLLAAQEGDEQGARSLHGATWCRGAAGIALARLAALDVLDGPDVRQEIGAALAAVRAEPLSAIDHLCCGNFGRVDVLLEASRRLDDPALLAAAGEIATRALARTGPSGRFGCAPHGGSDLTDPSLFRGEAGIGLSLLRLAGYGDLPCVLRLASPPAISSAGPATTS